MYVTLILWEECPLYIFGFQLILSFYKLRQQFLRSKSPSCHFSLWSWYSSLMWFWNHWACLFGVKSNLDQVTGATTQFLPLGTS